ncbi:hypothetical protein [Henriciella aquimarina]|uniref:hypothetical protein n=1 Tax=Henriciella aquimarina TaxID=545261 RepID=UPI001301E82F|nr:hypothetical protein [Henriciella aquimarina]
MAIKAATAALEPKLIIWFCMTLTVPAISTGAGETIRRFKAAGIKGRKKSK